MRETFLPFSPPCIGDEEIAEVADTLRSAWLTTGPKTARFEQEFANKLGAPAALAVNSATAALHTALAVLGVGPGDEVITTPITFAASVNVIEHVGARPVLVDVDSDTLNINPNAVAEAITNATAAILPVHFAGHPVDLGTILDIAETRHLHVLEDAAHALPASWSGRQIGSNANPTAFSFYATKNLTTGEGGMLTGSREFIDRARVFALHGLSRDAWKRYEKGGSWRYDIVLPGFKYNMTDIQASLGLWQLKKLQAFQARRLEIVHRYNSAFKDLAEVQVPITRDNVEHAWHLYVLRLNPDMLTIGRDQFIELLAQRNIGSSVHFIPIHLHPYYRNKYGYRPMDFPVALSNFHRIVSLPLSPALSDQDVDDVIDAVTSIVRENRR